MIEIQQAIYRGPAQHNGRECAAVEIVPFQQEYGKLLVYVAPIVNGGFEILKISTNPEELSHGTTDAVHVMEQLSQSASMEAANEWFVEQDFGMDWNAKSHFLDNVLSSNEVRSELERQFGQ